MTPAGPINISNFGWPTVVAVVVVATTALALDFATFRTAELAESSRHQNPAASQQEQHQQVANGVRGSGSGSDAVQVSVRPGRSSAAGSSAAENRVHRNRACVLAMWILAALVSHRWVLGGVMIRANSMHRRGFESMNQVSRVVAKTTHPSLEYRWVCVAVGVGDIR